MTFKSRKLYLWLISAGAIFIIYLFYNLISRTPPIELDTEDTITKSNTVKSDGKVGKIGDIGVGKIQKAKYTHLNTKKQVDREFGFEKLLHVEGNEWEIDKPYMNIYRHNLKCYMTADKGMVRIEDAVGRPTPTDATLIGNVVIHILPESNSKMKEGFVYLDDLVFISEKSQFSTVGPVKFISQDAQMLGKGLEAVYNDEQDHLEFLKIIELESLRIKQPSKASLFSPQSTDTDSLASLAQTDSRKAENIPTADKQTVKKNKNDYYKCVFRKNVVIDCPDQLILADEVSISDILWSKSSDRTSEKQVPLNDKQKKRRNMQRTTNELNEPPGQPVDIVVTCDNGITVVPMDSPTMPENLATDNKALKNDKKGRPMFVAQTIDYSLITEAIVASRPSELTFYAHDITNTEGSPTAVPVKVTAQEKVKFLPVSNQVTFEGNVLCTMLKEEANFQQKYTLSAPKLKIDLYKDKQSGADIKHLTAIGEVVQLDSSKWAGNELLGFTKLKCLQFDYDAAQQMFLAAGSGIIAVDNSKIARPAKKAGKFSLQRPCYTIVRNFDTLKYLKDADLIIADAGSEQILIDYFPIIKGKQEQQISATANHIEAVLYETSSGQTELSTLSAEGGITYEEEKDKKGKTIQFVGSQMFYNNSESMITAWGDESQPCFLNGALAPGIEYNLKTNRIKTKITGPGMLRMER